MPGKRLSVEPPNVTVDDLEDFLATDDLFVEYFNYFLALPTFPEPLFFNKERGGFEVVSSAKKEITNKIRTLVQQSKKPSPIYRAATFVANAKKVSIYDIHAYERTAQEPSEIKTSFTVQCLNKEQGIQWIKMERLPAFLQSETYLEYRLAKLVSQAELAKDGEEAINLFIDSDFRPFSIEKPATPEPVHIDETEIIMKEMFVCMGNTQTTSSEEWFTMAKNARRTNLSSASGIRPLSSAMEGRQSVATTLKPTTIDSGIYTPSVYEGPNLSEYGLPDYSHPSEDGDMLHSRLFDDPPRLKTPPTLNWKAPTGDDVCMVVEAPTTSGYTAPVFYDPDQSQGKTNEASEVDEDEGRGSEIDKDSNMDVAEAKDEMSPRSITVESIDDLATVVVAMILKQAISIACKSDEKEVDSVIDNNVLKQCGGFKSHNLKIGMLDEVTVKEIERSREESIRFNLPGDEDERHTLKKKVSITSKSSSSIDQEEDSLFGSDVEDETDPYFSKQKTYNLCNRKGIDAFRKFLDGTSGEKNWNFWLDVDKARSIGEQDVLLQYLGQLREKYIHSGSRCELPREVILNLGLHDLSSWNINDLALAQYKMVEPLLLYWGPRFLMKQTYKFTPDNNYLYQRQKTIHKHTVSTGVYPNPKREGLLPLRPKSCKPRVRVMLSHPNIPLLPTEPTQSNVNTSKKEQVSKLPSSPRGELEHVTISVLHPTSAGSHVSSEKSITQSPTMIPKLPPAPFVRVPSPPLRIKSGKKSQGSSRMGSPVKSMGSPMLTSSRNTSFRSHLRRRVKSAQSTTSAYSDSSHASSSVRGSRPGSAKSSISSLSSEFLGSAQMESLLQGLHNENKAGGFFMTFLERTENTTWINCLQCWHELQSYHEKFYAEIFNSYELDKKAQAVHSKYIVEGCKYSIGVDSDTRKQIYREIDPPFEELFDSAEEHILQLLVMPWTLMAGSDKALYQKIELVEEKRHLETSKSKHLKSLQRRGLFKERVATPEFIDEDTKREAYFLSLEDRVPEEFKDFSFNTLIHNRLELEQFRLFLNDNYASMDLMCWLDIEAFRRIPHSDNERRDEKAKEIKQKYLNKKYFFGPNSPAGKEGQNKVMQAGGGWGKILQDRPPTPVLLEVQKYVRERLERRWLPMFICTSDFQERQHPQVKMDEVVDDVMMNKRKKTQQVWKMLESRWVSSSRDIIAFRKVLMNPVSCMHFRKFVSVRGENLENDVLFWLEVQRYKDLYHAHTEDGIIHQKIQAVIHCFLDSQIPPPLQIDIPQEQAEKILDKRPKEMGPYVFREAQLTVFRVLFAHWADFCNYRNTMDESKMVEELEKKRRRHRARERARQRALEEREAKEEVRRARREKGLAEEDDDDSEMRSQAGSTVIPASPLADFLQEEEEEQHIQWRYSNYIKALEKEEAIMNADEKASSILSSSELGSMTTKSATEDAKDESKSDETVEVHGDKKKRLSISQDMDVKGVRKINKGGKENDKSKQTNNMDGNTTDVQSDTHRGKKKVSMAIDGKDERPGSGGEKVKKVKMTLNGKSPRQTVPALKIKK